MVGGIDLAHVSFEQLAEVQDKLHGDKDNKKKSISKDQILRDLKGAVKKLPKQDRAKRTKEDMKRDNRHKPMEISSKRAVSRLRDVVPRAAVKRRDPRFDKLSGDFHEEGFEKSYAFLEQYKESEKAMLQERIKREKDPEQRAEAEALLTKMISREKAEKQARRKKELLRERKKAEATLVKQGKKPYFLKKSEEKKLFLMDQYKKLGEKNMDKILEKRRRKNAAKDHRRLPFKRRSE
ncbi:hypothetical protein BCR43DRAFT_117604 [Syncephalastrum racemosum]|uniref:rRNA biogenesis protein RRP36 n=1 Tax=Syncephalastrum racemosum TaxID=13706 RepID=A0A1X2GZD5_SYNRA|nr:hypothetical protein BCR43DRAFT_117604 [Syncephalastrum racemosum]